MLKKRKQCDGQQTSLVPLWWWRASCWERTLKGRWGVAEVETEVEARGSWSKQSIKRRERMPRILKNHKKQWGTGEDTTL